MYLVKRPLSYGGYLAYRYCKEKDANWSLTSKMMSGGADMVTSV
jgi:hypothetical protein